MHVMWSTPRGVSLQPLSLTSPSFLARSTVNKGHEVSASLRSGFSFADGTGDWSPLAEGFVAVNFVYKLLVFSFFHFFFVYTALAWVISGLLFRFFTTVMQSKPENLLPVLAAIEERHFIRVQAFTVKHGYEAVFQNGGHAVQKEFAVAGLLWPLGLCWRAFYFISDHLLLKIILGTELFEKEKAITTNVIWKKDINLNANFYVLGVGGGLRLNSAGHLALSDVYRKLTCIQLRAFLGIRWFVGAGQNQNKHTKNNISLHFFFPSRWSTFCSMEECASEYSLHVLYPKGLR